MQLECPQQLENFIGGTFMAPINGNYIQNTNPATAGFLCEIPDSDAADVALAVSAAQKAFPDWSQTSAEEKFRLLNRIADLIEENLEALALAECNDSGKPLWLCREVDIPRASSNFRFFATGFMHFASESHSIEGKATNITLRQPVGIAGCISPWNLPLYLLTWKIAPALAAGNCVVAKPSEVTPSTAYLLAKIGLAAGLPEGVLNIVHGTGPCCGEAIVTHPLIKAISFTGSTRAGERIASLAAPKFKKLSLELGGKNPTIVFADCDWEKMLPTVVQSSFSNQGQICLCGSRIMIEASIYEKFKTDFIAAVKQLQIGDPLVNTNNQGALSSKVHFDKVMGCIDTAISEGGKILCGGNSVHPEGRCKDGYFIAPTVFENLGPNCNTNREEIFGPVVTLQPFDSADEALKLANDAAYGLAASIWTQNIGTANKMATKIESGIVWINCWMLRDLRTPFGGVKNSGVGREGGWDALRFFTETKNVCTQFE
jgi:aminomuconate-semialdehyde/2-hydroxymuconate-6-semialdehyde dehydrogenase